MKKLRSKTTSKWANENTCTLPARQRPRTHWIRWSKTIRLIFSKWKVCTRIKVTLLIDIEFCLIARHGRVCAHHLSAISVCIYVLSNGWLVTCLFAYLLAPPFIGWNIHTKPTNWLKLTVWRKWKCGRLYFIPFIHQTRKILPRKMRLFSGSARNSPKAANYWT